jgi:hypothetical protein
MSTQPRVLIPDLDDELVHALHQLEELLLTLAGWESDPDEPARLPEPLAGEVALAALRAVWAGVRPTQSVGDRPAYPGRLLGPDGRYEHRPLRLALLDPADVAVLSRAGQVLGLALATQPHGELAEAMAAGAEAAALSYGPVPTPGELVETIARVTGVLTPPDTGETRVLAELLADAGHDQDIVLTTAQETAYQRIADQLNLVWALGSGLTRFTY